MPPELQYEMLVDSLRLMAASSQQQLSILPEFVCAPDEVMGNFSDAYLLVPQLVRRGFIRAEAVEPLRRVDELMETGSGRYEVGGRESLISHEYWENARVLARAALRALGEDEALESMRHISYFPGGVEHEDPKQE